MSWLDRCAGLHGHTVQGCQETGNSRVHGLVIQWSFAQRGKMSRTQPNLATVPACFSVCLFFSCKRLVYMYDYYWSSYCIISPYRLNSTFVNQLCRLEWTVKYSKYKFCIISLMHFLRYAAWFEWPLAGKICIFDQYYNYCINANK